MTLSIGTRSKGQMILRLCVRAIPPVQRVAMLAANCHITIKQVKKIWGIAKFKLHSIETSQVQKQAHSSRVSHEDEVLIDSYCNTLIALFAL